MNSSDQKGAPVAVGSTGGSADWQAQVDALIDHTRSFVALPTDGCVMTSLAAQVLLTRKQIELLRSRANARAIKRLPTPSARSATCVDGRKLLRRTSRSAAPVNDCNHGPASRASDHH
jgi:hypothetical protein